jgi:hypothetical protein
MFKELISATLAKSLIGDIVYRSLSGLGRKYSVDFEYVINDEIQSEFNSCLRVSIEAFVNYLDKCIKLDSSKEKVIVGYLRSLPVSEEIWHLLDPGSEYFDRGRLTQDGYKELSEHFEDLEPEVLFEAWEEFLQAFSFASRSAPALREFLRASYEAGSFKALSNIESVLEKMGTAINNIYLEESITRQSIKDYTEELRVYRDWATSFQVS